MNSGKKKVCRNATMTLALLLVLASASFCPLAAAVLSDEEAAALVYMREEEKLARDIYIQFYEKWKLPAFKNIWKAEQKHMNAIKTLLDRYGLPDPAAGAGIGVFQNEALQARYQEMLETGLISLTDALLVGVAIEETDIDDLTEGIAITTHKDIRKVFSNLRQASFQHLATFQGLL